jgi:hypothetical protein
LNCGVSARRPTVAGNWSSACAKRRNVRTRPDRGLADNGIGTRPAG